MSNDALPVIQTHAYNQNLAGYYGEIGSAPCLVRFLQAAVPILLIDKLTLVSEMGNTEKWPVRQLFQRDIDQERVQDSIMPYFTAADKIKFFNPLTIVVLPVSTSGQVLTSVAETHSIDMEWAKGDQAQVVEADGYYRIRHLPNRNQFSMLEWNHDRVKLVAVDGQHRLSALKRLKAEFVRNSEDPSLLQVAFDKWTIPIVLLVFSAQTEAKPKGNRNQLLENMRDIFVTINTNAQKPNRCRTILLNDFSATAICCQELLDYCHSDGEALLPLLFFDWRAHNESNVPENPAAYMRVEDLEDIHIHYLIGEDDNPEVVSQEQRERLFVDDMTESLSDTDAIAREQVRKRYRNVLMPAVVKAFCTFGPFKTYVDHLTKMKSECVSDVQKHAYSQILFGTHHGTVSQANDIAREAVNLVNDCSAAKQQLPLLFQQLIGFRGIFCGLELAMDAYNTSLQKVASWDELVDWYIPAMNRAHKLKLFDKDSELLRYICFDPSGVDKIVNYRLEDQRKALGVYCALIACAFDKKPAKFRASIVEFCDTLENTLQKGYQRQVRPQLKDKHPGMEPRALAELVKKNAEKLAADHAKKIKAKLAVAD